MAKRSRKKSTSVGAKKSAPKTTPKRSTSPAAAPGPPAEDRPLPQPEVPVASLHLWQIQAVRDLLFVTAVIALFWVGYLLRAVTVPLLVAILLAYLVEPLIIRLCRTDSITRVRAVSGLLALLCIGLVFLLALVLPVAVGQATRLANDIQTGVFRTRLASIADRVPDAYFDEFRDALELLPGMAELERRVGDDAEARTPDQTPDGSASATPGVAATLGDLSPDDLTRMIDERVEARLRARPPPADDPSDLFAMARGGANAIFGVLGAIVRIGLVAFLIPFYFFFFSLWYPDVVKFARGLAPEKNRTRIFELTGKMDAVISGFVRGRIVISAVMGVLLAIGWMICGVPYSITLGLVVGVFCAVPYLGGIGVPLAIALLFFDQLGLPEAERMSTLAVLAWPTIVFAIVQIIEGYVLTPAIAGKATNLDPVTIIVAVLAGGSVLGVYGMLLAIPAAACGKIFFVDVLFPRIKAWTKGEVKDPLPIDR